MGKGQPPADEKEQLRQLTREAHEAAQELRDALREWKATRLEWRQSFNAAIGDFLHERTAAVDEYLTKEMEDISGLTKQLTEKLDESINQTLGVSTPDEIGAMLSRQFINSMTDERFLAAVAKSVITMLGEDVDLTIEQAAGGFMPMREIMRRNAAKLDDPDFLATVTKPESTALTFAGRDKTVTASELVRRGEALR